MLVVALALHVTDEAVTDFLPLYNSLISSLRESYSWVAFPTFSFSAWMAGLIVDVGLLLAPSPPAACEGDAS